MSCTSIIPMSTLSVTGSLMMYSFLLFVFKVQCKILFQPVRIFRTHATASGWHIRPTLDRARLLYLDQHDIASCRFGDIDRQDGHQYYSLVFNCEDYILR